MHPTMEVNTSTCSFQNEKKSNVPQSLGTDHFRFTKSREPTSAVRLATLRLAPLLGRPAASQELANSHCHSSPTPVAVPTRSPITPDVTSLTACSPAIYLLDHRRPQSFIVLTSQFSVALASILGFLSVLRRLTNGLVRSFVTDVPPTGGTLGIRVQLVLICDGCMCSQQAH